MIIAPEAVREYGVSYLAPGDRDRTIELFAELWQAEERLERLAGNGMTNVEIVSRTVTNWQVLPEGLIATVRALAEAHVDDQVTDEQVADRLCTWLPNVKAATLSHAWEDLRHQIEEYRKVGDGDVDWNMTDPELRNSELLVQHCDGLVIDAVKRVIGSAA